MGQNSATPHQMVALEADLDVAVARRGYAGLSDALHLAEKGIPEVVM